jgi:hypothetical protein
MASSLPGQTRIRGPGAKRGQRGGARQAISVNQTDRLPDEFGYVGQLA